MATADLSLDNANWTKGLEVMTGWIWLGHYGMGGGDASNLTRYFLHIPGVFEQQLNFSTTLLFDHPSFKNGCQISGFVDRVSRELAISMIAQLRHCWYSMTHHALIGRATSQRFGLSDEQFAQKWSRLLEHRRHPQVYTRVERAVLEFAEAFATNAKEYTDEQYQELRAALKEDNQRRHPSEGLWMARQQAARTARAVTLIRGASQEAADSAAREAADAVSSDMPEDWNDRNVNAQVTELAFVCLQFVALTDMFTALNVPDEPWVAGVLAEQLPGELLQRINELNALGPQDMPDLLPPSVDLPLREIRDGRVQVAPATLTGNQYPRIPLTPYEGADRPAFQGAADRDGGLTVGGVQVGVYGWSFGGHFPGSLPYCLMNHPELARYEAPYSLPLLFNEDEWRNGVQTAGYVSRRLKELVIQKVYRANRCRYGIEHHTMYFYNTYLAEFGMWPEPAPGLTEEQQNAARTQALSRATQAALYAHAHNTAPSATYTDLERAVADWTEQVARNPHLARDYEENLRRELDRENRREIEAGLRTLDTSPGIGEEAALRRLQDHQVAELAMVTGHMDGLARVLTMLRLVAEDAVQMVEGEVAGIGQITPTLDEDGYVQFTGYYNNRPSMHTVLGFLVDPAVNTLNELLVNPELCTKVKDRLRSEKEFAVSAQEAAETGEF